MFFLICIKMFMLSNMLSSVQFIYSMSQRANLVAARKVKHKKTYNDTIIEIKEKGLTL